MRQRRTLTERLARQARALYVGSDDMSLRRVALALRVDHADLAAVAEAEGWYTARLATRRWLAEDAARRALQTGDDGDGGAAYAAMMRRSLLTLAERIVSRCATMLDDADRTSNDVRCIANAAEAAQRMARLELGLPTASAALGVEVSEGQQRSDAWHVLRELSLGGGTNARTSGG